MKRILISLLLILCLSAELIVPAFAAPTFTTSEAGKAFIREVSGGDQYLAGAESAVNSFIARYGVTLNQQQFDALVDFVVSYDTSILSCGYKVETVIGSGSYTELQIANAFCSWVKEGNNFSQARLNRRLREIKLFLYGSYDGVTDKVSFRYVVYNGNGGKISDNTVLCYTLNGTYGSLPTASYSGRYFAGWYTDANGGTHLCNSDSVTQNHTVYAHWSSTAVNNPNEANADDPTPINTDPNNWPPLAPLKISEAGIQFIKNQEGFVPAPIWDYGQYSVGYGSRYDPNNSPIKISVPITEAEADYLLRYMLKDFETMVDKELAKGTVQHTQVQYDALISFAYNLGQQWISSKYETYRYILYGGCTEMQLVNSFGSWCSAGGSVLTGLCRRRMDEANLYLNGDYTRFSEAYSCLIFNGNGGTPNDKVQYYHPNTAVGALPGATRSGYHLTDWYTSASGGTPFTAASKSPSSGTMTLYAHWAAGDPPPTEPTAAPTEPTEEPTEPTVAPTEPTVAPTEPTVAPTEPTVAPTEPTVAPTEPTVAPTEPTVAPTEPTVAPTEPTEPTVTPTEPTERFTDVPPDQWYYEPVMEAVEAGLFGGVSETEFAPDAPMTRAMLVTVLHRMEGAPAANGTAPFTDVARGEWYTAAVDWAYENGIVNGMSETIFGLKENITRQQLTAMLFRYANLKGYDTVGRAVLDTFEDGGTVADYAVEAMQWATWTLIVSGDNGRLLPNGNATRAQCAKMITVFRKIYE
ncbi:MAG: S-layer homology domain-containing protein [Oscillospiraceae bacterium]|nr:S-layer homology domain-containing protein [Oscillospiraceae bacterium]